MQGDFAINTKKTKQAAEGLSNIRWRLQGESIALDGVRRQLWDLWDGSSSSSYGEILRTIKSIDDSLSEERRKLDDLKKTLESCADTYKATEKELTGSQKVTVKWADLILGGVGGFGSIGKSTAGIVKGIRDIADKKYGKGAANIAKGLFDGASQYISGKEKKDSWTKLLFGVGKSGESAKSASEGVKTGWWSRFTKKMQDNVDDFFPGKNATGLKAAKSITKWAGVALTGLVNGFSNYEEHGGFTGRFWEETITETAIDVVKGVAVGAATAALLGPGVPAAIAAAGVIWVADLVTQKVTGGEKGFTEAVSDFFWDKVANPIANTVWGIA